MEPKTTAITPAALSLPAAFEPANLDQALALADRLAKSQLLPKPLQQKPQDVLIVMMLGRELGLQAMQSLRSVHVIEGRPSVSSEMLVALCLRHPDVCEYFILVESTDKRAAYETKRRGAQPVKLPYTIEQAQRAGLANKDNWRKNTEAMLRARAAGALARAVYPDLIAGIYVEGEVEELHEREINPPPAAAAPATKAAPAKARPAAKPAAKTKSEPEDAQVEPPAAETKSASASPEQAAPPHDPETGIIHDEANADGKDIDIDEVVAEYRERIEAAETVDALKALVPAIGKLPQAAQDALRPAYGERKAELTKQ